MHEDLKETIDIPEGVEVSIDSEFAVKGPKGEVKRKLPVELKKENKKIIIEYANATKNEKKLIKTSKAHIQNMFKGVTDEFEYLMQICSVHFPITASVQGDFVAIKNFLGETKERKAKIVQNTKVKIEGDIIKIKSPDIEAAGQTAANIETATKIRNRDRTRFQDGIWIIKKAGEEEK
jgi:large subunit ribosomal protein L6